MPAISVGIGLGLIILGVLAIIFAGIRSLMQGKQDYRKIAMMAVPFVVFGISYAVLGEVAKAAVMTAGILMAFMIGSIAFTGLRGTFKF